MTYLDFKTAEDYHFDYAIQFLESCVTSFSDVQKLFDKGVDLYILELDNNVVDISTSMCDSYDYVENNDYAEDRYSAYVFIVRDYDEEDICKALNITIPRKNYIEVLSAIDYEETSDPEVISSFMDALADGKFLKDVGVTDFDIEGVDDAYCYLKNKLQSLKENI